ncbi:sigma-70 family RNA polymerase sigma factor [soil metagenome]
MRCRGKRFTRPQIIACNETSGGRMPSALDHEWFLSVLDAHQRLIQKVCWAYTNSPDDREDLFQEITVRLLSAVRNYDPSRKLSTWIYRVALNVAIDAYRKRRYQRKEQLDFDGDLLPATAQEPAVVDQLRELRILLERQPEVDRALLLLHLEGNTHREIAEVLGFSESNVGTRLSRLKASLRKSVESTGN